MDSVPSPSHSLTLHGPVQSRERRSSQYVCRVPRLATLGVKNETSRLAVSCRPRIHHAAGVGGKRDAYSVLNLNKSRRAAKS